MVDQAKTHADRQKRYRQRQRAGEAIYRVKADDDLLLALLAAGRLTEQQALDRGRVEQEIATVLTQWALHWRR